jgi:putative membrane protein
MVDTMQRVAAAVMSASLLVFGACSGRNGDKIDSTKSAASGGEVARPDSAAGAIAPGAAAIARPESSAAAPSAASTPALKITGGDPEILQVLAVVDQAEMQDGQLAQKKAHNAQVKSYARELVNDHTKALQQDRQVAKSANVDLSGFVMKGNENTAGPTGASGITADLINMHAQTMDQVRRLEGAAFDSAFVGAPSQWTTGGACAAAIGAGPEPRSAGAPDGSDQGRPVAPREGSAATAIALERSVGRVERHGIKLKAKPDTTKRG